ncbi:MAG: hypothetical protein MUC51_00250 [Anaerolineae bacterium]|nr:hypothetical protein [Anaerolineae bacterium]
MPITIRFAAPVAAGGNATEVGDGAAVGDGVYLGGGRRVRADAARRVVVDVAVGSAVRVGRGVWMGEAPDVADGTDGTPASATIGGAVLATATRASPAGAPNDVSRSRYAVAAPNSPRHNMPRTTNARR